MITIKIKLIAVLLACVLLIAEAGCSGSRNPCEASPSSGVHPICLAVSHHPVLQAYRAVLLNKNEFFSTDNQKELLLNDFLTNKELYAATFTVTRFAVLDMDGDHLPEVVLELSVGNEPQFFEVLYNKNGTVYGCLFVYRALEQLKEDGTFRFSSSAADSGFGRLRFAPDACKTDALAYSLSSWEDSRLVITYFIDNKPVTKKRYDAFAHIQAEKKAAVWHSFSQNTIEAELSVQ